MNILRNNVSQVDKVWMYLPTIYTAYYALLPLWPYTSPLYPFPYVSETVYKSFGTTFSPRALLMLALVVIWMLRLTFNTWRRGFFNLDEPLPRIVHHCTEKCFPKYSDRLLRNETAWCEKGKKIGEMLPWWLQTPTFYAVTQNILFLALAHPVKIAVTQPHTSLGVSDYLLGSLGFLVVLSESIADNQLHSYQSFKRSGKLNPNQWFGARITWTKQDAERGFVTQGLWAWSRHPNIFCEQSFWVIINLIPLVCADSPRGQWPTLLRALAPLLPSLSLCAMFVESARFTESVSMAKYPVAYKEYQERVGMFEPLSMVVRDAVLRFKFWFHAFCVKRL